MQQRTHLLTAIAAATAFAGFASGQTFTSQQDGSWDDPNTWDSGVPNDQDHDVVIEHAVTLNLADFSGTGGVTAGQITIKYAGWLQVSNSNPDGEKLHITADGALDGSVTLEAEDSPGAFMTLAAHAIVRAQGDVTLEADGRNVALMTLQDEDAVMEIAGGVLTIERDTDPARIDIGTGMPGEAGTLVFSVDSTTNPHAVGGLVQLVNDTSEILVEKDTVLGPYHDGSGWVYGEVVGMAPGALIGIKGDNEQNGKVLTNRILVRGKLIIDEMEDGASTNSEAFFVNAVDSNATPPDRSGEVWANADGTLKLGDDSVSNTTLVIDDDDTYGVPIWRADGEDDEQNPVLGELRFETAPMVDSPCPADVLVGDFKIVGCGTLSFGANIETQGDLDHDEGFLLTDSGVCFTYLRCDPFETQNCTANTRVGPCN